MINTKNIMETINMIDKENLDIRTITMGISLMDCIDSDGKKARIKIYDKITRCAENLVKTAEQIETEYGIPIIHKRVSVSPISLVAQSTSDKDYVKFAQTLDKTTKTLGIDFIGGFTALVHKGYSKGDRILIESIPEALASTNKVCSSVNVATTKAGINMDAVKDISPEKTTA